MASIFALLAGAGFGGVLPQTVSVVSACVALAGLVAAFQFTVEARHAGADVAAAEAERERAEWSRRVLVADLEEVDPIRIGVDPAAQDILPGADVPDYVPRAVDSALRAAVAAALEGTPPWLVVVEGPSKAGKSRSLFEAVRYCTRGRQVRLIAPSDGAALRDLVDRGVDHLDHVNATGDDRLAPGRMEKLMLVGVIETVENHKRVVTRVDAV